MSTCWNRRSFLVSATALTVASTTAPLWAQTAAEIDPRDFGFEIPPGKLTPGGTQRVQTNDRDGQPVVARLHVSVGENRIVLLPDGELVARSAAEAQPTDRPFVPLTKAEMARRLLVDKLADFKSKESRRYLYLYNTSENFATATSKILESMVGPITEFYERQGLADKSADLPLVVIMFRTEEEFQRYRRMPPGVVAYYNVLNNQVVMYEESKLAGLKPELAIQQSISTIAHEGVHQILHNIGVQQRLSVWPLWLAEGLAEYFAPTSVGKNLSWKGAGKVNDLRMYELEVYLKAHGGGTPNGQMIVDTVSSAQLTSSGYASAWALTMYLSKAEKASFNRYVAEMSKLGPLEGNWKVTGRGFIPANLAAFQKHFGSDMPALEGKLTTYLKSLPYVDPFAEWPHFAAMVATTPDGKGKREANVFHSSSMAERWVRDIVAKLPEDARSKAQSAIRAYANRGLAQRAATEFLKGK